jgi:hypothetical protein
MSARHMSAWLDRDVPLAHPQIWSQAGGNGYERPLCSPDHFSSGSTRVVVRLWLAAAAAQQHKCWLGAAATCCARGARRIVRSPVVGRLTIAELAGAAWH